MEWAVGYPLQVSGYRFLRTGSIKNICNVSPS